jgi:hypothetical protein
MERTAFSALFCLAVPALQAQCVADAGADQHLCGYLGGGFDTVSLGGDPVATGGLAPYAYEWTAYIDPGWGWTYDARDMLDDTSLAHPALVSPIGEIWYTLSVTDAQGNTCVDSVFVGLSSFGTTLDFLTVNIVEGDSFQFFAGSNVVGDHPPLSYVWHPSGSLSDSTSLTAWASPTESTDYYLTVTDSMGCAVDGSPYYLVSVAPLGVEGGSQNPAGLRAFPSPAKEEFTIALGEPSAGRAELLVRDMSGRMLERSSVVRGTQVINCGHWPSGVYVVEVQDANGIEGRCRIVVE